MNASNKLDNVVNWLSKNTVGENPTVELQNQVIRQTNEILDKQEFILKHNGEKFNKESLKDRVGELIEKKDFIGLKGIILNIEKNDIQVGYYNYFHSVLSECFEEKVSSFKMNSMFGKIGKLLCFMYENGFVIFVYLYS